MSEIVDDSVEQRYAGRLSRALRLLAPALLMSVVALAVLSAEPASSAAQEPTPTPEPSASPTASPTPTSIDGPTATATPTSIAAPTSTATPTPTSIDPPTATPTPTVTPAPPTVTPTPTVTPAPPTVTPTPTSIPPTPTPTPTPPPVPAAEPQAPGTVRVAFFADTQYSILNEAQQQYPYDYPDTSLGAPGRALKLIYAEGAELALHGGDIGYDELGDAIPSKWDRSVTQILGASFPMFASAGNHDRFHWQSAPFEAGYTSDGYSDVLANRYFAAEADPAIGPNLNCTFDTPLPVDSIGRRATCTYKNITFVTVDSGQWEAPTTLGQPDNLSEGYLKSALESATTPWLICNWHFNQTRFQTGSKRNEAGWKPYEYCRQNGAIIATGHEHAYARTHLMSRFAEDASPGDIELTGPNLTIDEGETIAWVSGLGGVSPRVESREGQNPHWAMKLNASSHPQAGRSGAVFCDFKVDANSNAVCYYKMIDGVVYDRFELVSNANGGTGTFDQPYIELNAPPFVPNVADKTVLTRVPLTLAVTSQDADGPDPVEYWSNSIPPGLTLNRASGLITGTPTQPGDYTTEVHVWDGVHNVDAVFDWTVEAAPIVFDTTVTNDCLAENGRIILTMTNTGPLTETVVATISGLPPRTLTVAPQAVGKFTWTGRPDGQYAVGASAAYDNSTLVDEGAFVLCDPPITITCLAGNGRIDINVVNPDPVSHNYVVTFGQLSPRSKLVSPGKGHKFSVTGRPDGPIDVEVRRDGFVEFAETAEIDCDPDPPAFDGFARSAFTCLANNGRIDIYLANDDSATATFVVTFGSQAPRERILDINETTRVTTTGRPDGPSPVRVRRDGVTVLNQTIFVNCD